MDFSVGNCPFPQGSISSKFIFGYNAYIPQFQYYAVDPVIYNRPITLEYGHSYSGVLQINGTGFEFVYLIVNISVSVNESILASKNIDRFEASYDIEDDSPEYGDITEYLYFTYTPQKANETLVITLHGFQYDAWSIKIYADLPVLILKNQETFKYTCYILLFVVIGVGVCWKVSAETSSEFETESKTDG